MICSEYPHTAVGFAVIAHPASIIDHEAREVSDATCVAITSN